MPRDHVEIAHQQYVRIAVRRAPKSSNEPAGKPDWTPSTDRFGYD